MNVLYKEADRLVLGKFTKYWDIAVNDCMSKKKKHPNKNYKIFHARPSKAAVGALWSPHMYRYVCLAHFNHSYFLYIVYMQWLSRAVYFSIASSEYKPETYKTNR